MSGNDEFVNVPDRFVRLGWDVWARALRELFAARGLCWSLTKKEIVARYRQSLVGPGWAIITPLATVAVFTFLHSRRLIDVGETAVAYPVFLYLALLPWQLFHACLVRTTSSLASSSTLVSKTRFPHEILVLSAMGSAVFDFLVGLVLLGVLCLVYQAPLQETALLAPLLLPIQLLLSLSLGLVLGAINAAARDLKSAVAMGGLLWLFLTPVFYPAPLEPTLLSWINPMAALVTGYRALALGGPLPWGPLAAAAAVSLVLLPLAWRLFHIMIPRVAQTV